MRHAPEMRLQGDDVDCAGAGVVAVYQRATGPMRHGPSSQLVLASVCLCLWQTF